MKKNINYYFEMCEVASWLSHDAETEVGCLLINKETRKAIGVSQNQFIDTSLKNKLPNTKPNKYFYIQHAEARLIYEMAKYGISTNNSILICTHSPCMNCARLLFQSGINTIYFKEVRKDLDNINYLLDLKGKLRKLKSGYYKLTLSVRE